MDFSERFSQALQATLGMEMCGQLGEPGLVRFSPSTVTFGTEELEYRDGVYSFYQYERASRDGALFDFAFREALPDLVTLQFSYAGRMLNASRWLDFSTERPETPS